MIFAKPPFFDLLLRYQNGVSHMFALTKNKSNEKETVTPCSLGIIAYWQ